MNMKSILKTILFCIISVQLTLAQDFKLGKVTIQELEQKQHPKDPDAEAAFLFNTCYERLEYSSSESGFIKRTIVKTKLKIYKKEGLNWANFSVPFYNVPQSRETVTFSDTYTYNLENGKIVKTKLKNEGKFEEKLNRFWSVYKITFPDVKEGSIIEFEYTINSSRIFTLTDWDFQKSIPVDYSEIYLNIPEYFIYKPHFKGFISPVVSKNARQFTQDYTSREVADPTRSQLTNSVTRTLDYREDQIKYSLKEIPAIKEEQYVNNMSNYSSSIVHELMQIQFPNSPVKNFSTDWETVVNKIYEREDFGDELKKSNYFEEDLVKVLEGKNSRDERLVAIFEFVKSKVKWNKMYGYSCDDGVKQAYKNKVGNVAEINLILTAMLRHAGIEANPVLVSTRSHGISFFPSQTAYNYVITAVEIENDLILLDATEPMSTPNVLPTRVLNWFGRIIRKSGSSASVNLMPRQLSIENYNLMGSISVNSKFSGKMRKVINNHAAFSHRLNHLNKDKDSYIEFLENSYGSIDIKDYQIENDKNHYSPITETIDFEIENSADIINDKLFFSPMFFLKSSENPFKAEKREYPVDFTYPFESNYNIIITIPDGYAVESYPEQVKMALDELASFSFLVNVSGNKIQLKVVKTQKTPIISSEYYESLKEYYQKMVDKQNEKIVLKKI